jgi:hypothetical protein
MLLDRDSRDISGNFLRTRKETRADPKERALKRSTNNVITDYTPQRYCTIHAASYGVCKEDDK